MIDILSMPALAILVVVYLIYVWVAWLRDKNGRALNISAEDERDDRDEPPRFHD